MLLEELVIKRQNKNICIVTYHMVPHTSQWGASQRMHFLANALFESGYDVTLIHASFGKNNSTALDAKYRRIVNYIYPSFLQKYQSKMQKTSVYSSSPEFKLSTTYNKIFCLIRPLLITLYRFIDKIIFNDFNRIGFFAVLWNISAFKILKNIHNQKKIDLVIISGPYFTNFQLLSNLKDKLSVPVFLDYRDPWNLLREGSFYTRYKEKILCEQADQLIFFSDKFRDDMIIKFALDKQKCLTVYNGYDQNSWSNIPTPFLHLRPKINDKFVISYVSSSITLEPSSGRDPTNFINAISSPSLNSQLHLNLVGCDDINSMSEFLSTRNISCHLHSRVEHQISLSILSKSHLVVVLSSDEYPSVYTLTGKIFDCIRSGSIIIGISNKKVAYNDMIVDNNLGFISTNSQTDIEKNLHRALDLLNTTYTIKNQKNQFSKNLISNREPELYSRSNQNQKLITKIDSFLNKRF